MYQNCLGAENEMAIGERIRFIRKLRKLTQKQLGIAIGFPESSADVRMAQYETGTRTPKEDLIKAIANIFEVSQLALNVPDIDSHLGLMHTFFALEDIYGLEPEIENERTVLRFNDNEVLDVSLLQMIFAWTEQTRKFKSGEITKEEYDKWRYNYPEYDNTQIFAKVPSKELSDVITDKLK